QLIGHTDADFGGSLITDGAYLDVWLCIPAWSQVCWMQENWASIFPTEGQAANSLTKVLGPMAFDKICSLLETVQAFFPLHLPRKGMPCQYANPQEEYGDPNQAEPLRFIPGISIPRIE
ncbi:hypothetical protein N7494_013241, partial [Penicillium frequentans]